MEQAAAQEAVGRLPQAHHHSGTPVDLPHESLGLTWPLTKRKYMKQQQATNSLLKYTYDSSLAKFFSGSSPMTQPLWAIKKEAFEPNIKASSSSSVVCVSPNSAQTAAHSPDEVCLNLAGTLLIQVLQVASELRAAAHHTVSLITGLWSGNRCLDGGNDARDPTTELFNHLFYVNCVELVKFYLSHGVSLAVWFSTMSVKDNTWESQHFNIIKSEFITRNLKLDVEFVLILQGVT
ncbi:hypothetical protein E2C01_001729 [Portunus trituberculatus]|uniref:Uncharacterized protein n=1 Tax=Portunus trituberculatus TaxID=210409 RepID=A0A5B7CI06_PORTR|nr:hypothetical protein [Portunus trituberculatus]